RVPSPPKDLPSAVEALMAGIADQVRHGTGDTNVQIRHRPSRDDGREGPLAEFYQPLPNRPREPRVLVSPDNPCQRAVEIESVERGRPRQQIQLPPAA